MRTITQILFTISIFLLFSSCAAKKDSNSSDSSSRKSAKKESPIEFELEAVQLKVILGACFGQCPAEEYSVDANGTVFYHPIKYGTYPNDTTFRLNTEQFQAISKEYDVLCSDSIFPKYPKGKLSIADLPSVNYTLTGACNKTIKAIHPDKGQDESYAQFMEAHQAILLILRNQMN